MKTEIMERIISLQPVDKKIDAVYRIFEGKKEKLERTPIIAFGLTEVAEVNNNNEVIKVIDDDQRIVTISPIGNKLKVNEEEKNFLGFEINSQKKNWKGINPSLTPESSDLKKQISMILKNPTIRKELGFQEVI